MYRNTFRGGVHPDDQKGFSRDSGLVEYTATGDMVFPLSQHIGKPASPVVKRGDEVLAGQLIAEAGGFISANILSSCSGKVKAIEKRRNITGALVDCIVIANDGQYNTVPGLGEDVDWRELSAQEIIAKVKDAGIVGMGGAGFPTNVKLMPKNPDAIRYIIANGAECEPYITADDQLMRTHARGIVEGMKIILKIFPKAKGVICIEQNKPEAIAAMRKASAKVKNITVQPMKVKYPQGGERSLIQAIAGVNFKGRELPADVGCIVDNVATIYAIYEAVARNTPLMKRCISITGDGIAHPQNFITRIGTSHKELIEAAGGIREDVTVKKVLSGGPMMGFAVTDLDAPVQKANNALTILDEDEVEEAEQEATACIRCGRCIRVCPVGLAPCEMSDAAERGDFDRYENKLYGLECISCGSCTFICPAKKPLMQTFKQAKSEIMAAKRAAAAKEAAKK